MKENKLNKNDKLFYFTSSIVIFSFFSLLFYFSFKYILNIWAYSDAFINYSEGFIRRGLLGELMIFFSENFSIKPGVFHSSFFMTATIINILLFLLLLKDYSSSKFIFVFILFNPALILFPLYDNGGYLRKDIIFLTVCLFHCYVVNNYHKKIFSLKKYFLILYFLIIPLIVFNTLMHELQLFLLSFHICLTFNVVYKEIKIQNLKNISKKNFFYFFPYVLTLIPLIFFFMYPTTLDILEKIHSSMTIESKDKATWAPIYYTSKPFFHAVYTETKYMFSSLKTVFMYLSLLIMSILPIVLIFNYLEKNNFIKIKNYFLIFISVFPIFLMFFIGRDWGRWVNLIAFTVVLFFLQNPINKKLKFEIFNFSKNRKNNLINILVPFLALIYLMFIMVPHCCTNQAMFGGLFNNMSMFFQIIVFDTFDLGEVFKPQS